MGRPVCKRRVVKNRVSITLSDDVLEWLRAKAMQENRSFSNTIETLVLEKIGENNGISNSSMQRMQQKTSCLS